MASTGNVLWLYHCTAWTVLVPLVQWSGMASTVMYIYSVFVLVVLYLYYCTVCTVRVPLVQWFSMASTGRVPIGPCLCSYCDCTIAHCVVCLYLMYSGLAWPAWVMYILPVFVLVLCVYYCTVCTVRVSLVQWFSMASTGRVPIGPCLYSYCSCTIAQCLLCLYLVSSGLAWPARAMYLLTRFCTRTVRVLLHSVYCACAPCAVV